MKRIGRYEVQSELGRGGFGKVFRAYDPTVGRYVALKALHETEQPDMLSRFRSEAAAAGRLKHPNIVVIHDFGEQDRIPYIVMEYLEGEDLEVIISGRRPLSIFQKLDIMAQAASGLNHAHRNGIVHRDIKPSNLMVLADGTVKIMDFGIARLEQASAARLTPQDALLGTFSYMAPEQFYGSPSDALTDLFALGVTFYKLLAGTHPFGSAEMAGMMHNIMNKLPEPLSAVAPDCPEALESVVLKMLAKERDARYQSVEDVKFDVESIIGDLQRDQLAQLLKEARELADSGSLEAAEPLVRQALEIEPGNRTARDLREQLQRLSKERTVRPQIEALLKAGNVEMEAQRFDEAIRKFESALRLDRSNEQIGQMIGRARSEWDRQQRADRLVKDARRALEVGELTAANRGVSDALSAFPEHALAKALSDEIREKVETRQKETAMRDGISESRRLLVLQSFDAALDLLRRLQSEFPESREVARMLDSALRDQSAKLHDERLRANIDNVKELIKGRRYSEAKNLVGELAREFPESRELSELGTYAAEEDRALKRSAAIGQVAVDASALIEAGRYDNAIDLLKKTIEEHPSATNLRELLQAATSTRAETARNAALQKTAAEVSQLCAKGSYARALEQIAGFTAAFGNSAELDRLRRSAEEELEKQKRVASVRKLILEAHGLIDEGRADSASQILGQATLKYSDDSELTSLLEMAQGRLLEQRQARDIKQRISEVEKMVGDSRFEDALTHLDRVIVEHPSDNRLTRQRETVLAKKTAYDKQLVHTEVLGKVSELRRTGQLEAALNLLDSERAKVLRADPEFTRLRETVHAGLNALREKERVKLVADEAEEMVLKNDLLNATQILGRAVAEHPSDERLTRLLEFANERLRAQNRASELQKVIGDLRNRRSAGQLQEADELLRSALAKFPGEVELEAEARRLEILKRSRNRQRAISEALARGQQLLTDKKFKEARQLIDQAVADFPEESAFLDLSRSVQQLIEDEQRTRVVDQTLAEATLLLNARRYSDALIRLEGGLQTLPLDPGLLSLKEEIYRRQQVAAAMTKAEDLRLSRDFDEALRVIEDGLLAFPNEGELLELLPQIRAEIAARRRSDAVAKVTETAQSLLEEKKIEEAVSLLQEAAKRYPDVSAIHDLKNLAETQVQQKLHHQSIERTKLEAQTAMASGQPERAVEILEASPLAATEFEVLLQSAREALRKKRHSEAVKEALGLCDQGRFEEAQAIVQRALLQLGSSAELGDLQQRLDKELKDKRRRDARERDLSLLLGLETETKHASPRRLRKAMREVESCMSAHPSDTEIVEVGSRLKLQIEAAIPAKSRPGWKLVAASGAVLALAVVLVFLLKTRNGTNGLVTVEVRTDPAGASIRLGNLTCVTPNCGFRIRPGQYGLEAALQGYQSVQRSVTIQSSAEHSYLDFTLEPTKQPPLPTAAEIGTVIVTAGQPRALIYVDDKPQTRTGENGSATLELPAGIHFFRVEKLGFSSPDQQRATVAVGKVATLAFPLVTQARPPEKALKPKQTELETKVTPPQLPAVPIPDPKEIEAQELQRVRSSGDPSALRAFLQKYPSNSARADVENQIDDLDWSQLNTSDSKSLSGYLGRYPSGRHAQEAKARLADLAWIYLDKGSESALEQYIAKYADSSRRHEADTALAALRTRATAIVQQDQAEKEKLHNQIGRTEEFEIDAALAQLNFAFKNRQPKVVRKIWPDIPSTYTEAMRLPGTVFTMALTPVEKVAVAGETAFVFCDLVTTTAVQGKASQAKKRVRVELRKSADGWIIASVA